LEHPSQWLWSYRRWKRCPAGDDIKRFPFYAKEENRRNKAAGIFASKKHGD